MLDEVQNFGGAHASNDALKSLITQEDINIEGKGKDAFRIKDMAHYVFLTNHDWPIKIETSDRRYMAAECSSKYAKASNNAHAGAYFKALRA